MVEKWAGKNAIVTGCGSGIGAAVFSDFLKNKINVIGLDIQVEKTVQFLQGHQESEVKAVVFQCDIADPESVKSVFQKIEHQFGVVHVLVNCAGIGR